jgi:hypothetical protein
MFNDTSAQIDALTTDVTTRLKVLSGSLDTLQVRVGSLDLAPHDTQSALNRACLLCLSSAACGASEEGGGGSGGAGARPAAAYCHSRGCWRGRRVLLQLQAAPDGNRMLVADPLSTVQGISHSDAVVLRMQSRLASFTQSLKSILQVWGVKHGA